MVQSLIVDQTYPVKASGKLVLQKVLQMIGIVVESHSMSYSLAPSPSISQAAAPTRKQANVFFTCSPPSKLNRSFVSELVYSFLLRIHHKYGRIFCLELWPIPLMTHSFSMICV